MGQEQRNTLMFLSWDVLALLSWIVPFGEKVIFLNLPPSPY